MDGIRVGREERREDGLVFRGGEKGDSEVGAGGELVG